MKNLFLALFICVCGSNIAFSADTKASHQVEALLCEAKAGNKEATQQLEKMNKCVAKSKLDDFKEKIAKKILKLESSIDKYKQQLANSTSEEEIAALTKKIESLQKKVSNILDAQSTYEIWKAKTAK